MSVVNHAAMKKTYSVDKISFAYIKTTPVRLQILADGMAPTTGWSNGQLIPYVYVGPPAYGVWDFDLVGDPPDVGGDALSPISANYVWMGNINAIKGVRIHASSNKMERFIGRTDEAIRELQPIDFSSGGDQLLPLGKDGPFPRAAHV